MYNQMLPLSLLFAPKIRLSQIVGDNFAVYDIVVITVFIALYLYCAFKIINVFSYSVIQPQVCNTISDQCSVLRAWQVVPRCFIKQKKARAFKIYSNFSIY